MKGAETAPLHRLSNIPNHFHGNINIVGAPLVGAPLAVFMGAPLGILRSRMCAHVDKRAPIKGAPTLLWVAGLRVQIVQRVPNRPAFFA